MSDGRRTDLRARAQELQEGRQSRQESCLRLTVLRGHHVAPTFASVIEQQQADENRSRSALRSRAAFPTPQAARRLVYASYSIAARNSDGSHLSHIHRCQAATLSRREKYAVRQMKLTEPAFVRK